MFEIILENSVELVAIAFTLELSLFISLSYLLLKITVDYPWEKEEECSLREET